MRTTLITTTLLMTSITGAHAQRPASDIEFFEANVRPLLAAKCYGCHSEKAGGAKGGLLLDSRAGWQKGGNGGAAIAPGDSENSRMIRAIRHLPGVAAMPPGGKLSEREISVLVEWVRQGAPDPRGGTMAAPRKPVSKHWAFQPIKAIAPPRVKHTAWVRTPIDAFVLAKLEAKGLQPSPRADRRTLLRRVTFDLTGLPPTPEETTAFLADKSPNAYEKVVDRLLASPRYGERWARHWLDVAHYGDTHGYDKDKRRDNAWPYRDYVIRSLNADKPYSLFLREQIAGDVLYPNDPHAVVATGFLAAGPWDFVGNAELAEGTIEKEKTRTLDRDDMVANAIGTFNSVTIHCARCHDHKFDPIPQKDYYRLQAVFAGVERGDRIFGEGDSATASGSPSNGYHSAIEPRPDTVKWVQIDLGKPVPLETARLIPARPTDFKDTPGFGFPSRFRVEAAEEATFAHPILLADHTAADFPNPGNTPVVIPAKGRTARYLRVTATKLWERSGDYVFALAEVQVPSDGRNVAKGAAVTALDSIEQGRWSIKFLTDGFDSRGVFGRAVYAAVPRPPRPIYLLARGEAEQKGEEVEPGALSCVRTLPSVFRTDTASEGARRAALAEWLASPRNPLTWRSIVNRVWHYHFGRGLVDTPNDFGLNGSRPTHPELLDWLAGAFSAKDEGGRMKSAKNARPSSFACGMHLKPLHRLLVLSNTYRQAVARNPEAEKEDGDNRWLWRMNRRRLDAEEIRDATLAVSGTLDLRMGGPGYEPFRFKDDHSPIYDHTDQAKLLDPRTWRRTVYRFAVRSVPDPLLDALDAADPNASTPVRNTTLTALQSLSLWNNPFMVEQAARFAARLRREAPAQAEQIRRAYLLAFSRPSTPGEQAEATAFVSRHGLENFCRILLNASEFVFAD